RGELEVGTVVLHGLQANLARTADGVNNWDDLVTRLAAEEQAPAADAAAPGALPPLALGGVEIRNAAITYTDAQVARRITLAPLDLPLRELRFGPPADLDRHADLATTSPPLRLALILDGELLADPAAQRFGLMDVPMRMAASGDSLPVSPLDVQLDTPR